MSMEINLSETFMAILDSLSVLSVENAPFTREKLIEHQKLEPQI